MKRLGMLILATTTLLLPGLVLLLPGLVLPSGTALGPTTSLAATRPLPASPHPIHGYVVGVINVDFLPPNTKSSEIPVPDIAVAAINTQTGELSRVTETDPYGYFRTPALKPGTYNICVSGTGYIGGCDPQVVTIGDYVHVMDHPVRIITRRQAVIGTVTLADKKTPCFWYDPSFDANFTMTAKVTLSDANGIVLAGPVRGNHLGEYLVPLERATSNVLKVSVACEAAQSSKQFSITDRSSIIDFVMSNSAPTANLLEAAKAGVGVRRASPGDALIVTVPANDVDHDTLHFRWVDDSGSAASFPDAASVTWSAPAATGPHSLRVLVSDGHGGYAVSRTTMNVGPDEFLFSGTAVNRVTNAPVAAASVFLNGATTTTDAKGHFQIKVPDHGRFVLNLSKLGFALASQIFYARATDVQIPMDPVQIVTIDGKNGGTGSIEVIGCKPLAPKFDTDVSMTFTPNPKRCEKLNIGTLSLTFPPNALTTAGGTPFAGPASVEAFQFDLSQANAIPGDLSAKFQGEDVRMQTFGAFHLLPRDPAGNPLKLASGKTVDVSMPIHPLALASAPNTIPFFSYDEPTGLWVQEGDLHKAGSDYVGKITHFSEFNADSTFGSSSCMKVQLDQNFGGFPSAVILNASYDNPQVGNFNHPNTLISDTQNPIVLERLVPNEDFHLQVADATSHAVLQNVLLNSGPPDAVPFPVPFPYDGCKPAVVFNNGSIPPTSNHFLISATTQDNSADYQSKTTTGIYASRDTLPNWLTANGFGGNAIETHATYFNNGDLKFGRDMHCRNVSSAGTGFSQDWIACYVTNYGSVGVDFAHQPSNPVTDAYNHQNQVATVAMEYHPDQTDQVQFWAYNAMNAYLAHPALDVEGGKPMPDICMACHQGSYLGPGTFVHGATFLPFDIDSFLGDDGNPLQSTLGQGAPRPTQEDFRQLNQFALVASNTNTAIQELMNLWYKDGGHPNGVQDAGATYHFNQGAAQLVNNNFPSHPALYDDVVKVVCRTCHVARDPDPMNGDTWSYEAQMTRQNVFITLLACGPGNTSPHHTMPHAQVPYKRFWTDNLETTLGSELSSSCSP
jgi:hypothetical protein